MLEAGSWTAGRSRRRLGGALCRTSGGRFVSLRFAESPLAADDGDPPPSVESGGTRADGACPRLVVDGEGKASTGKREGVGGADGGCLLPGACCWEGQAATCANRRRSPSVPPFADGTHHATLWKLRVFNPQTPKR